MHYQSLIPAQKSFLMVAILLEKQNAAQLWDYLPAQDQALINEAWQEIEALDQRKKKELVIRELKSLSSSGYSQVLSRVHPDWLVASLSSETPRMIATILRYLPAQQVRLILDRLPPEKVEQLPPLSETFSLNPELAQVLKKKFETHLEASLKPVTSGEDSYLNLNFQRLHDFLIEVGLRELALAFSSLDAKMVSLIQSRLDPENSQRLKLHLNRLAKTPVERLRRAQSNLLAVDFSGDDHQGFLVELGLFLLSKTIVTKDQEKIIEQLKTKLSFKEQDRLKAALEKNQPLNSPRSVKGYQEELADLWKGWKNQ